MTAAGSPQRESVCEAVVKPQKSTRIAKTPSPPRPAATVREHGGPGRFPSPIGWERVAGGRVRAPGEVSKELCALRVLSRQVPLFFACFVYFAVNPSALNPQPSTPSFHLLHSSFILLPSHRVNSLAHRMGEGLGVRAPGEVSKELCAFCAFLWLQFIHFENPYFPTNPRGRNIIMITSKLP
jgi:hypothetical protein